MIATTVSILFVFTSGWFGHQYMTEVLRFETPVECEAALATVQRQAPTSKFACINRVVVAAK